MMPAVFQAARHRERQIGNPRSGAPRISAVDVGVQYPGKHGVLSVLDGIHLAAADGEFVSIIGPSGCGKSTLLNVMAGLQRPTSGTVCFDGQDVTGRLGHAAYMFQRDLLLPWKSVLDNTAMSLELQGVRRRAAREQALAHFARFGLAGFENRYPSALSGGMRQRAALLRTVLTGRDVLLLDEPFGALDALTRADMQQWLLEIWRQLGKTVVFVTHDVDEALFLSDTVYVISPRPGTVVGHVDVQFHRPRERDKTVIAPEFALQKAHLLQLLHGRPAP